MLQKETSATTSSKSATSNRPEDTPVQFVKGVGPWLGSIFSNRGIATVKDLLHFFPRAYEDRSKFLKISELTEGTRATVSVQIVSTKKIPTRQGRVILDVKTEDGSGMLSLKWFHAPKGMEARLTSGSQLIVTGQIKIFMGKSEMIHPEITWNSAAAVNVGRVVPIYTEIEGVSTRILRKVLWEALEKYRHTLVEDLPLQYVKAHALPTLGDAVQAIHFPDEKNPEKADQIQGLVEFDTPSHWRLIYEEFFKFEYLILRRRLKMEKALATAYGFSGGRKAATDLESTLPFKLTGDQKKAVHEVLTDLGCSHPMNRLIQGDVGSGKTAVAFLSAGAVLSEGGQAVLMVPTEILAEQHFKNAQKIFGGKLNVAILTGKTPASERTALFARLSNGEPLLLIGTHAVLEEPVKFQKLAFVMVDEQHRFGVEQRRVLRNKGIQTDPTSGKKIYPHTLVLTATPIPRTLALTAYGDLSVTPIQEMPPGRTPVITKLIQNKTEKGRCFELIKKEVRAGKQVYFIFPLVNDSEAEGFTQLKSAVAESERLARDVFPEFKVGLLHGQLKPDEKIRVMDQFKRGEIQVLVSTTVVEVGVDVPNATVMVVEHSERFGLSQLHQLRGRVGRGSDQSYCFFLANPKVGENTGERLGVLEETSDGFKIAEADLKIRGPGEFLGTRQAGVLPFKLADLVRDQLWLFKAREDALQLLREDPDLVQDSNRPLRGYFEREGYLQSDRLNTS